MIFISATFTADPLKSFLEFYNNRLGFNQEIVFAPYNQVFQQILNPQSSLRQNPNGINILLIRIEDLAPKLQGICDLQTLPKEIDQFSAAIIALASTMPIPLLVCLCPRGDHSNHDQAFVELYQTLENKLREVITAQKNCYFFTTTETTQYYPVSQYHDTHAEEIGHVPYTQEYFCALATFLARKIHTLHQAPYKVILLDCDNTLWKGVCGELGPMGITLDPARLFLQDFMLKQYEQGMLLCLCSKNNEEDVLNVFEQRPDMHLKLQHIVATRINWHSKPHNIYDLAKELNLGVDSFIFIDDNPVECAEIQARFPEILCLTLPEKDDDIPHFLNHVWAFDPRKVTNEDKNRTQLYHENQQREQFRKSIPTFSEFIANLNLQITIMPIKETYIERVAQLTQRTNQFNLMSLRYTEPQLNQLLHNTHCLIVHVTDRFGDYGLVGALFYQIEKRSLIVVNCLLSCRVLGKGVEHQLLNKLGEIAIEKNLSQICLQYVASNKNMPALLFLKSLKKATLQTKYDITQYVIPPEYAKQFAYHFYEESISNLEKTPITPNTSRDYHPFILKIANDYQIPSIILNKINPIKKTAHNHSIHQNASIMEARLIYLWENTLKIAPIIPTDHFLNLGGNSLLAALIIAQIWKETDIKLNITEFLNASTVRQLAALLSNKKNTIYPEITSISEPLRFQPLRLSYAQERLWFIQQLDQDSSHYNMFTSLKLSGHLNVPVLEQSFHAMVCRHESLRTYFIEEHGAPKQVVHPKNAFQFQLVLKPYKKISDKALFQLAKQEAKTPFDLTQAPLLRATLIQTAETTYYLFICLHHIIHDGWSFDIFCKELNHLYLVYLRTNLNDLELPNIQYTDFTLWQRQFISQHIPEQIAYWQHKLQNPPVLQLPTKHSMTTQIDYSGKRIPFVIDAHTTLQLKNIAKQAGTTLYTILLAAFSVLLAHYSGQEDMIIGSPFSGRHYPGVEKTLGFFINLLALRIQLTDNPSFQELLNQIKLTVEEAYLNQDAPFDKLVQILKPNRNEVQKNPLIQVFFAFQNFNALSLALPDVEIEHVFCNNDSILLADFDSAKFDLSLYLQEKSGTLSGLFEYSTALFSQKMIHCMRENFHALLREIVQHPEHPVFNLRFLDKTKSHQLLTKWSPCSTSTVPQQSIQHVFEIQAKKTPDNIAISYHQHLLTYKQLNEKANQLARLLLKKGASVGDCIVVYTEADIHLPIHILATLKAGCIYVPIPHDTPIERLRKIYHDCQPSIVLTQKPLLEHLKTVLSHNQSIVEIDDAIIEMTQEKLTNLNIKHNSAAYIIYTSGSTGHPKGVILKHQTITNLISWQSKHQKQQKNNKISQYATFGFDVSLQEIFFALFNGYELCIVPSEIKTDMSKLVDFIRNVKINTLFLPTPVLDLFLAESLSKALTYPDLTHIIVAGEKLTINGTIKSFFMTHSGIVLTNHYGPSETHVVTAYDLSKHAANWDMVPSIGKPIDNTQIYILNKYLTPVPIGAIGEICVAGSGVAKGYLNQPDSTASKFIINPFYCSPHPVLYRTGDLGYWRHDGNIEYVGREDNQVKIRGFRVELGEIEEKLLCHPSISHAVVLFRQYNTLVAHLMLHDHDQQIGKEAIIDYLEQYLPPYMIPHIYKVHDQFPLTQNGKIDKDQLATLASTVSLNKVTNQKASGIIQQAILNIFSQLLNIEKHKISIHDNFFAIGGHSLLVVHLIAMLKTQLDIEISIHDIFDHPSIKKISDLVEKNSQKIKVIKEMVLFREKHLKNQLTSPLLLNKARQQNLFLIHPLSGTAFSYMQLAKELNQHISCYGIQYPAIEKKPIKFNNIPEIAHAYLGLIKKIQPAGPYYIGGHSFGGLIALEIAYQLHNAQERVHGLYLFDTWVLSSKNRNQQAYYEKYFASPWEETITKQIKTQLDIDLHKISHHLFSIAAVFTPHLLKDKITLFKALHTEVLNDETNYLSSFSTYPIQVHTVPGDHESMLTQPYVKILAKKILICLKKDLINHGISVQIA